MKKASQKEIKALIDLIDDPEENIFRPVRMRILEIGPPILGDLENAWETMERGDIFQRRVENLVHDIQIDEVHRRLRVWVKGGGEDLLEGAFIICRYRYPDLDEDKMKAQLRALRQDIWLELGDNLTAFEKVRVINHVIYHVHGFKGNKKNYHAPQNCYLNEVLDGRKGNPLSLAMIYQIVSEELNLPVLGVNLPNHFVLAYMEDENTNKKKNTKHNVLFYINPFSQGDILGRKEVDEFLQKLNLPKDPTFYQPCTNIDTIRRQFNNLIRSYEIRNDPERVREIEDLRKILPAPPEELGRV